MMFYNQSDTNLKHFVVEEIKQIGNSFYNTNNNRIAQPKHKCNIVRLAEQDCRKQHSTIILTRLLSNKRIQPPFAQHLNKTHSLKQIGLTL